VEVGTSYHEHPDDNLRPPDEWYESPDAKKLLGTQFARALSDLASEIDGAELPLDKHQLQDRAGQLVIRAYSQGFLRGIPNLGRLVEWHTASGENDRNEIRERTGIDPQAVFVRCPYNLILDIVGGHKEQAQLRSDGTLELLGPKLDDGILPAIDPLFKRGDAAQACRFLADNMARELGAVHVATTIAAEAKTIHETAKDVAERIAALPNQIVSSFALKAPALRVNLINEMTGEISARAFSVITWIERNRPAAANLEKARLFQLQDQAEHCAGLDIPEYAGGVVARDRGAPITGNIRLVAEFSVFCLLFSKAMLGWSAEIEAATSVSGTNPRSSDVDRANSANTARLFPGGVPENPDIVDLVVRLDAAKGGNKSQNTIAREFTNESPSNDQRAQSLLSQIRRLKREGRITL
jgi:hypothetical protein